MKSLKIFLFSIGIVFFVNFAHATYQQVYKVVPDTITWRYQWYYVGTVGVGSSTSAYTAFMKYDGNMYATNLGLGTMAPLYPIEIIGSISNAYHIAIGTSTNYQLTLSTNGLLNVVDLLSNTTVQALVGNFTDIIVGTITFGDGTTMFSTSTFGGGTTYWDINGSTIHPTDVNYDVAIGTDEAQGAKLRVLGKIVGGASDNSATGDKATVLSGEGNTASGIRAAVVGGMTNDASANHAFIGAGDGNSISAIRGFIGAGVGNTISGQTAVIGGGDNNSVTGTWSTIGGGINNIVSQDSAIVGGGYSNTANGSYAAVLGGRDNTASGQYSIVSGGYNNSATNADATISGGDSNSISVQGGAIPGGEGNTVDGNYGIAGGYYNSASGLRSICFGGSSNNASATESVVIGGTSSGAGGNNSVILGGTSNNTSGLYSIAWGNDSAASGDYSVAGGRRVRADHDATFILADDKDAEFYSQTVREFAIRFSSGMRFVTNGSTVSINEFGDLIAETTMQASVGNFDTILTYEIHWTTGAYSVGVDTPTITGIEFLDSSFDKWVSTGTSNAWDWKKLNP